MATTFPTAQADDRPAAPLISGSRAGRAGATAAGVMLAVQLIWRLNWSDDGVVQAFPELVAAAIARLTPLSVFGAATENYGSLAKKTLFVTVLFGILLVGYQAGRTAGRMSNQIGPGFRSRLGSALIVAGFLWLATNLLILPIAYLGTFASQSSHTSDILIQLTLTFALFALVWAFLTAPVLEEETDMTRYPADQTISRRTLITRSAATVVPIAAGIALGGGTWRLLNPPERSTGGGVPLVTGTSATGTAVGAGEAITVQDIVATQRANQGYGSDEATTPPETTEPNESSFQSEPRDVAQADSDVTPADDPFALYNELEAEGNLTPVLTETDDFYHVSKNFSDPRVDGANWTITIGGMVNTPLTLTLEQLTQRAITRKITTLGCISNELNGHLIGTAEWIGVPLADLLNEAGVQAGVVDLKLHAADDYEDSIPLERGLDPDTLVVVGMNGETLRDDHGFPARLIVPGIYGMKNVKWLDRIELVDHDFQGYWQTRGWSDPAPYQIWGRIDHPDGTIKPGPAIAAGVASAGDRDVARVEISLDDGATWADAQIEPSLNPPFTWVRWAFPFDAVDGQDFTMKMRVTDGEGTVMDENQRPPLPDGATGWPSRGVKVRG